MSDLYISITISLEDFATIYNVILKVYLIDLGFDKF